MNLSIGMKRNTTHTKNNNLKVRYLLGIHPEFQVSQQASATYISSTKDRKWLNYMFGWKYTTHWTNRGLAQYDYQTIDREPHLGKHSNVGNNIERVNKIVRVDDNVPNSGKLLKNLNANIYIKTS